jgi:hypothetical protein
MKTLLLYLGLAFSILTVSAADKALYPEIRLQSGEVLKDAVFLSQTPTHVTFKVGTNLRQIEKKSLPAELQKLYPPDDEAARRREAMMAEAKRAYEQRQADRAAAMFAATAPKPEEVPPEKMPVSIEDYGTYWKEQQVAAVLQGYADEGKLNGKLGLDVSSSERTARVKVQNLGDKPERFDWRKLVGVTIRGVTIPPIDCRSLNGKLDFDLLPGQKREYVVNFGTYHYDGNYVADVRWKLE